MVRSSTETIVASPASSPPALTQIGGSLVIWERPFCPIRQNAGTTGARSPRQVLFAVHGGNVLWQGIRLPPVECQAIHEAGAKVGKGLPHRGVQGGRRGFGQDPGQVAPKVGSFLGQAWPDRAADRTYHWKADAAGRCGGMNRYNSRVDEQG